MLALVTADCLAIVANLITALTLAALFYQIKSGERQFVQLNQGYLDAAPQLMLVNASDSQASITSGQPIPAGYQFKGLNIYAIVTNVGNLPIRYRLVRFSKSINDESRDNESEPSAVTAGIIYPKQQTTVFTATVFFDRLQERTLNIAAIQKLKIQGALKIEYTGSDWQNAKTLDRAFSMTYADKGAHLLVTWIGLNDKW